MSSEIDTIESKLKRVLYPLDLEQFELRMAQAGMKVVPTETDEASTKDDTEPPVFGLGFRVQWAGRTYEVNGIGGNSDNSHLHNSWVRLPEPEPTPTCNYPNDPGGPVTHCSYDLDHDGPHSWETRPLAHIHLENSPEDLSERLAAILEEQRFASVVGDGGQGNPIREEEQEAPEPYGCQIVRPLNLTKEDEELLLSMLNRERFRRRLARPGRSSRARHPGHEKNP